MKIHEAGMVLEEQPDKAGEAIRLFLQGLGYTLRNGRSKSVSETTRKLSLNITGVFNINIRNPKCRLYWCLIEFPDWRYSQSCWYFRPLL
jgi:hypothetical protein